jgi:Integrase core domain
MGSFFSTLKIERTNRTDYQTRDQAGADVFDYIERFYNLRRRHSTLGYVSPADYESSGSVLRVVSTELGSARHDFDACVDIGLIKITHQIESAATAS